MSFKRMVRLFVQVCMIFLQLKYTRSFHRLRFLFADFCYHECRNISFLNHFLFFKAYSFKDAGLCFSFQFMANLGTNWVSFQYGNNKIPLIYKNATHFSALKVGGHFANQVYFQNKLISKLTGNI